MKHLYKITVKDRDSGAVLFNGEFQAPTQRKAIQSARRWASNRSGQYAPREGLVYSAAKITSNPTWVDNHPPGDIVPAFPN
jgi:hypothetical protein